VTDVPPPPPPPEEQPPEQQPPIPPYTPPAAAPVPAVPQYPAPAPLNPADRVRVAWQRRNETDYIFSFWTALGWTVLTCGIYGFYVIYQLARRSKEHNLRRMELLDAATTFAWEQAQAKGLAEELRPSFDTIGQHMGALRQVSTEFRDPTVWMVLYIVATFVSLGFVVDMILYVLLDGDLVKHDYAEGAIENELATIYDRLGAPVARPDPGRLKQRHNYGARIAVSILTCGIYLLWWTYDIMVEGNNHFRHNWSWEDSLAHSTQQLIASA
jgi:hypothetical protein